MRSRISCAARRVKVSARMRSGASTRCSNRKYRCASNVVLPLPAGACTSTHPADSTARWRASASGEGGGEGSLIRALDERRVDTAQRLKFTERTGAPRRIEHGTACLELVREPPDARLPQRDELIEVRPAFERARALAGLEEAWSISLRDEFASHRIDPAVGHRSERPPERERIDGQLRIVGTLAPPVYDRRPGLVIDQHARAVIQSIHPIDAHLELECTEAHGLRGELQTLHGERHAHALHLEPAPEQPLEAHLLAPAQARIPTRCRALDGQRRRARKERSERVRGVCSKARRVLQNAPDVLEGVMQELAALELIEAGNGLAQRLDEQARESKALKGTARLRPEHGHAARALARPKGRRLCILEPLEGGSGALLSTPVRLGRGTARRVVGRRERREQRAHLTALALTRRRAAEAQLLPSLSPPLLQSLRLRKLSLGRCRDDAEAALQAHREQRNRRRGRWPVLRIETCHPKAAVAEVRIVQLTADPDGRDSGLSLEAHLVRRPSEHRLRLTAVHAAEQRIAHRERAEQLAATFRRLIFGARPTRAVGPWPGLESTDPYTHPA